MNWWAMRCSLYFEQNGRCHYCRRRVQLGRSRRPNYATIDHVVPRSLGGTNEKSNLVVACKPCNCAKGNGLPPADLSPKLFRTFTETV